MRQSTAAVIKALEVGDRMTASQVAIATNYTKSAVQYALAVLIVTDQATIVNPCEQVPVYTLTGIVCKHCGQVKR